MASFHCNFIWQKGDRVLRHLLYKGANLSHKGFLPHIITSQRPHLLNCHLFGLKFQHINLRRGAASPNNTVKYELTVGSHSETSIVVLPWDKHHRECLTQSKVAVITLGYVTYENTTPLVVHHHLKCHCVAHDNTYMPNTKIVRKYI